MRRSLSRIGPKFPQFGGVFRLNPDTPEEIQLPNTIVADGAAYFLRTLFRGEAVLPANFYIGLTNAAYTYDTATLAAIAAGEPNGAQGYARQAVTRGVGGWTVTEIGAAHRCRSLTVNFSATGTWSVDWTRMFLCDLSAGTGGKVFAISAATPAPQHVTNGLGPAIAYDFWLRP